MTNPNEPITQVFYNNGQTMGGTDGGLQNMIDARQLYLGLTKIEYFASKNMAALISTDENINADEMAVLSVSYARALIDALNDPEV